jgi:hypothetical protein
MLSNLVHIAPDFNPFQAHPVDLERNEQRRKALYRRRARRWYLIEFGIANSQPGAIANLENENTPNCRTRLQSAPA